jgi:hypothetical protein
MEVIMQTFTSNTHTATVTDQGILEIFSNSEHTVKESIIDVDGNVKVIEHGIASSSQTLRTIVSALNKSPLLRAAYAGSDVFHVDMDCGATRWKGSKPVSSIKAGLKHCKFSRTQCKDILTLCQQNEHEFMLRVG